MPADGQYKAFYLFIDGDHLVGSITLILPIASVGGLDRAQSKGSSCFDLLQQPKARQLASSSLLSVSVRTLLPCVFVTSGIQAGT